MKGFSPKRSAAGRKRDRPERPGGSAALGVFEARFRNGGHTTENISWDIMSQLIFRSVSDCSGQGKTRSHFRRGFYFARLRALGRWGRRHVCRPERRSRRKHISWDIMSQLIFRTIVGGGTALRNHRPEGKHYVRDGPLYGTVHRFWLGRRYSSCVSGSNR